MNNYKYLDNLNEALFHMTGYALLINLKSIWQHMKSNAKIDAQIQIIKDQSDANVCFHRKLFKCVRGELTETDLARSEAVHEKYLSKVHHTVMLVQKSFIKIKAQECKKISILKNTYPMDKIKEAARWIENIESPITSNEERLFLRDLHLKNLDKINQLSSNKINLSRDFVETTKTLIYALPLIYIISQVFIRAEPTRM